MKRLNIKTIALLAVTLLMATGLDAVAQRGRGMDRRGGMEQVCPNIPDLTEEQRQDLMELRTGHLKEMQSFRDQIDINRAEYRALMRGDRTDMAAINANIDERGEIRSQMEKKQAGHHQAIRNLLTEEQRVWFDAAPRGGFGRGAGMRQSAPGRRGAGMNRAMPGARGQGIMRNQPGSRRGF